MKHPLIKITMLSLTILSSFSIKTFGSNTTELNENVRHNNQFAFTVYQKLKIQEGNLIFSPYSISSAMALTYLGARQATAQQIAEGLNFKLDPEKLAILFRQLDQQLQSAQQNQKIELSIANSLWPQKNYPLLESYLKIAKNEFDAMVQALNYETDTESARKTINQWIKEKTKGKIKDMIGPGMLSPLTRLVLVNAIYFKGDWAHPFKKSDTKIEVFFLNEKKTIQTPMLKQERRYLYTEDSKVQAVEIPYAGNELSMQIILPKKASNFGQIQQQFNETNIRQLSQSMKPQNLKLSIPKFTFGSQFQLNQALKALGVIDAFEGNLADFSGMDGKKHWLYLGAVLHQAFIEVNETGSEATAATAVVMPTASAIPRPNKNIIFQADHPFFFLIKHRSTGAILFIGRVMDPSSDD